MEQKWKPVYPGVWGAAIAIVTFYFLLWSGLITSNILLILKYNDPTRWVKKGFNIVFFSCTLLPIISGFFYCITYGARYTKMQYCVDGRTVANRIGTEVINIDIDKPFFATAIRKDNKLLQYDEMQQFICISDKPIAALPFPLVTRVRDVIKQGVLILPNTSEVCDFLTEACGTDAIPLYPKIGSYPEKGTVSSGTRA